MTHRIHYRAVAETQFNGKPLPNHRAPGGSTARPVSGKSASPVRRDISLRRVRDILHQARATRVLVVGDVMLDQFVWGSVRRISPEAPVPIVEFERESYMPGGAANVARNLTSLSVPTEIFGWIGRDDSGAKLKELLASQSVDICGLIEDSSRPTSVKTRIIAHQQQMVRLDREKNRETEGPALHRLMRSLEPRLDGVSSVIVADYGKGTISQPVLDRLKAACQQRKIWISLDPKPVHRLDLSGLSLMTPNRKEAFELAGTADGARNANPLADRPLMSVAERLLERFRPSHLLITLGDQGMLLCQPGAKPFHIPTVAQEVFDVSGAGDTVIATFTLAVSAGASPVEAAILSNHAAGVVVGKLGTATLSPHELLASVQGPRPSRASQASNNLTINR